MVCDGYRLPQPASCSDGVYKKYHSCWCPDPEKRPALAEIVSFFREQYESVTGICLEPQEEYLAIGSDSSQNQRKRSLSFSLSSLARGFRRSSRDQGNTLMNPVYEVCN